MKCIELCLKRPETLERYRCCWNSFPVMFRQLKSSRRGSPHMININMAENRGVAMFGDNVQINDLSEAALQASCRVCAGDA